jgi:cell division septum initiation protein DivIVA
LVPLRTDFDLVLRGYDRDQVRHYVASVEADLRLLAIDRDAAITRAEELAWQLEAARAQNRDLSERLNRVCRTPIEPDALTERLRRMIHLAHAEADEITTRARAAAEESWATARDATDRLRQRHERLVAELDARRHEMETEHRQLMHRAHTRVETMTRQAEQRRRELDEQAARLREQVESDFQKAMSARRAEAMDEIADQQAAAQAQAAQLIREATERASRIVAEAQQQARRLDERRREVENALHIVGELLADAEPLLAPLPGETSSDDTETDRPAIPRALSRDHNGSAAA